MKNAERVPAPGTPPAPAPAAPPKRKRWKRVLLVAGCVLVGLLLAVVVLGPPIIGSVAESKIAAILGESLNADATVGNVSFSWSGHIVVDDLKVVPKGFADPLFHVKKVDVRLSLLSAAGGSYIADVELVAPKVIVEKSAEGRFNYEVPDRPKKEDGSSGDGSKPFVQAALRVRDGEVRVRAKGRETVYTNLSAAARVDTLAKPIDYSLSFESPAKDRLEVKGSYDLDSMAGPATLLLERVSLKNLTAAARAYSDVAELDGTVTGKLDYRLKGRLQFAGRADLEVTDFAAAFADRTIRIDRVTLTHDGTLDDKGNGKHMIVVKSGKALDGRVGVDVTDGLGARAAKTTVSLQSDLAALSATLRGLGSLPPGMALEGEVVLGGTVDSKGPTDAELKAGTFLPAATWDLALTGTGLAVAVDGKPARLDQVSLRDESAMDPKGNIRSRITLRAGKALEATLLADGKDILGGAREIRAKVDAASDLAELGRVLEKLIGMKAGMALEGRANLTGTAEVRGAGDAVKADLDLRATDLVAVDTAAGGKRHDLDRAIAAKLSGSWEKKTQTAVADAVSLRSSFATLDAKGGLALKGEEREIKPSTLRLDADLARLGAKLESFVADPPRLGGTVTVDAKYEGDKVTVDAVVKALRVTTKERTIGPIDATLRDEGTADKGWSGRHALTLKSGKAVDLSVSADLKDALKDERSVAAVLKLESDLGALAAMLPGLVELKPGMEIAGSASLGGRVETKGADFAKFDLAADVRDARMTTKETVKEGGKDVVKASTIGPIDAKVDQRGTFSTAKDGGLRIESSRVTAGLPGSAAPALDLAVTGEIRKVLEAAREGSLKLEATALPVEAAKIVPGLGLGGPPIAFGATVTLKPKLVTAAGRTKLDGLTLAGKDPATGQRVVRTAKTGPLDFSIEARETEKGPDVLAKLSAALFEWVEPKYAARGGLSSEVTWKESVTTGTTRITNLEVVDDRKNVVKEPAVTLVHDVKLGSILIRKVEVTSGFLRGTVKGDILEKDGRRQFKDLEARFFYHPDRLGAVLKPWLPGKLEGAEEKSLSVSLNGEAGSGSVLAVLRGTRGNVDVDLARFTTANGVSVSGKTQLALRNGVLASGTPLAVNKGQTRLNAAIDFRDPKENPRSTLAFNAKDVDANADMRFLEGVNPIFHTVNGTVDGQLSSDFNFTWTGPIDPDEKDWKKASRERLTGGGVFGARNLNIVGSPTVKDLMAALGEPNALQGELAATNLLIANGICSYKDMTLRAKRYELRFSGWVDCVGDEKDRKRMELDIDMPFTEHMVKKYPGLSKYTGQRFTVKLTGFVDAPRLDIEGMLVEYAKRAAGAVIQDKAEDLLRKLLDRKKKD